MTLLVTGAYNHAFNLERRRSVRLIFQARLVDGRKMSFLTFLLSHSLCRLCCDGNPENLPAYSMFVDGTEVWTENDGGLDFGQYTGYAFGACDN
jgi:hypothetical protein